MKRLSGSMIGDRIGRTQRSSVHLHEFERCGSALHERRWCTLTRSCRSIYPAPSRAPPCLPQIGIVADQIAAEAEYLRHLGGHPRRPRHVAAESLPRHGRRRRAPYPQESVGNLLDALGSPSSSTSSVSPQLAESRRVPPPSSGRLAPHVNTPMAFSAQAPRREASSRRAASEAAVAAAAAPSVPHPASALPRRPRRLVPAHTATASTSSIAPRRPIR